MIKNINAPRRVTVTMSNQLYASLFDYAQQRHLTISSLINLILCGDLKWNYRLPPGAFEPDGRAADFRRAKKLAPAPAPSEPEFREYTDAEWLEILFKDYRSNGGQINNVQAWVEAGKPHHDVTDTA